LEDLELADLVGDLGDHLDPGGAGTDDTDPLAGQIDRFLGPVEGVECLALEVIHARVAGQRRGGERAEAGDDES
jgi:hypothetical protein